jgi:hypothetical protein
VHIPEPEKEGQRAYNFRDNMRSTGTLFVRTSNSIEGEELLVKLPASASGVVLLAGFQQNGLAADLGTQSLFAFLRFFG